MSSVNTLNPKVDLTVRVFDSFNNFQASVNANDYDVVYSYFRTVFETEAAAKNMTVTLFRIAQETGQNVLGLLKQMANKSSIQLTAQMAYYLNGLRSRSTLLGVNANVTPNAYAARNVVL